MTELGHISRHSATVLVGQLAVMAFGIADTVIAGRYDPAALAALAVGSAVYLSVFVSLQTIVQALLPIYAEHHGAARPVQLGHAWRQSLYLGAIITAVGMFALLNPGPLMRWAQVPPDLQVEVGRYLHVLAWAFAPALLFRMFGTLTQAIGHPRVIAMLQLLSLAMKVPLSVWFTFGGLGLQPMGVVGCAWGTLVANVAVAVIGLWMLRTMALYQPLQVLSRMERPDWRAIGSFARLGVPGAMASMVEITSFTLMSLFIARQGNEATAAHQIAASVAAVMFMVPLSMGIAASARVSYWIGAGDPALARRVAMLAVRLTLGVALALAVLLALSRGWLASLYSTQAGVVAIAASLLAWVCVFHLFDALQGVCNFVLRSYRVTVRPFVVYVLFLWGLGLAGGYQLAYSGLGRWPAMNHPAAFWIAGAVANAFVGVIFALMLRHFARQAQARGAAAAA